jgi:hypothetical protein
LNFFELNLASSANFDDGNTASKLGKPFNEIIFIKLAGSLFDLMFNLESAFS